MMGRGLWVATHAKFAHVTDAPAPQFAKRRYGRRTRIDEFGGLPGRYRPGFGACTQPIHPFPLPQAENFKKWGPEVVTRGPRAARVDHQRTTLNPPSFEFVKPSPQPSDPIGFPTRPGPLITPLDSPLPKRSPRAVAADFRSPLGNSFDHGIDQVL